MSQLSATPNHDRAGNAPVSVEATDEDRRENRTDGLLVIPGILTGHRRIIEAAEASLDSFVSHPTPRALAKRSVGRQAFRPEEHNNYEVDWVQVASHDAMSTELRDAVVESFAELGCDIRARTFRLQRYRAGDYVLPHRDFVAQSLYVLTSSDRDGLVIEGDKRLRRIPDRSGTLVVIQPGVWHWVDPVLDPVRYTVAVSPPVIPEAVRPATCPATRS